jgi:hypothetical protein
VDSGEALKLLKHAVALHPELADEILSLVGDEYTPAKAAALFDYIFVIADCETDGTNYPVLGFRLRNADERLLARRAFDLNKGIEGVHS